MGLLLGGVLLTGWAASWLRYLQLVRLSGLAMRSVQRLREWVYGHVLRLPMAFFDRAITGQLVSRVTNDTEAVKTLYIQVLFVCSTAASCWSGRRSPWPGWTGA
jgi:ATP-binding cassette subfamily B multidrug efflux pump